MITTLLVLMLMSALLVGFTAIVISDQRFRVIDRDRGESFYAATGGIEKLTADLANLFFANVAPTTAQIRALTGSRPTLPGITYRAERAPAPLPASSLSSYYCGPAPKTSAIVGNNGYTIMFCTDGTANPIPTSVSPVKSGPFEGLIAAQTPFQLDVTARTAAGGETHLIRTMDAVAIPVFQFGIFSDVDLSFFAGPDFDFGGRVHTNGNLFLAQGGATRLTLRDKVTAVKEVVRQRLSNGVSLDAAPQYVGAISLASSPTQSRLLARSEGSVVDGLGSPLNEPTWHTISLSTYNSYIRNGRTGAKVLNLPLVTVGGSNAELVRRPATPDENVTNAVLWSGRLFNKASLRILLSDTAADIMNLPMVTPTPPVLLDGNWNTSPPGNGGFYGPIDAAHPPIARTPGPISAAVNGDQAANWTTLPVKGPLPAYFKIPAVLTVTLPGGAVIPNIVCTGKTAATFTGCSPTPALNVAANATVTAVVNSVSVSAATTAVWAAGSPTLTVRDTSAFAPLWFYVTNADGTQSMVTCTGYTTAPAFTGCAAVGGTKAVGANAPITTNALSLAQTGTIGGYLKIELQDTSKVWRDVTMEILNYGIGGPNLDGAPCGDPSPNSILRLQRLRDNGGAAGDTSNSNGGGCPYAGSANAADQWPNVLFDAREGLQRDVGPAGSNVIVGGVMHYVALDVANLSRWLTGTGPFAGGSGVQAAVDNTGFTVYFSDRRNNRNAAHKETGEYGFEDVVNAAAVGGAPNGSLDEGEDVNGNGLLDSYGGVPSYNGVAGAVPPGALPPLIGTATPTTSLTPGQAQVNRAILFRRALKLVHGSSIAGLGINGLTIAAENPVYLQGDWNAAGGFNDPHAATAVIADAVTLLSNNWNDEISFRQPYSPGSRLRMAPTWYRVAIIAGKGMAFAQPAGTAIDFGTDGGTHNFLRYLENGDQPVSYRGSIATFFYNRQAVGTYKCCTTVYHAPLRNYAFDVDFLDPSKLPPNTPLFRDMNAVGFSQEIRSGR